MNQDMSEDEDIAENVEQQIEPMTQQDAEDREMIEGGIDPDDWRREVQRVKISHRLKTKQNIKEWRAHLDQTKKFADSVKQNLPDVKSKLEKVSHEVSSALEKISSKEKILNRGQTGSQGNVQTAQTLKLLQEDHEKLETHVEELSTTHFDIEEELEKIQSDMGNIGEKISDTSPLLKIKKGIERVKRDVKQIDIRIGVVSNTLLQSKLKDRHYEEEEDLRDEGIGMDDI